MIVGLLSVKYKMPLLLASCTSCVCSTKSLYSTLLLGMTAVLIAMGCAQGMCPEEASLYGELKKEVICYKDKQEKHGIHIRWHTGGQHKKFKRSYRYNVLHGPYLEWYSNGQPKVSLNYEHGELNGTYKRWFSNGQIHVKGRYSDNGKVGPHLEYYKNGYPRFQFNYNELGKFEGQQTEYRSNGYKLRRKIYLKGQLIGKMSWNLDGQLDPILTF